MISGGRHCRGGMIKCALRNEWKKTGLWDWQCWTERVWCSYGWYWRVECLRPGCLLCHELETENERNGKLKRIRRKRAIEVRYYTVVYMEYVYEMRDTTHVCCALLRWAANNIHVMCMHERTNYFLEGIASVVSACQLLLLRLGNPRHTEYVFLRSN